MVTSHYPPDGDSSGVLRTLKFSKYLPRYKWIPHVLTFKEWLYKVKDYGLAGDIPPEAKVYRTFALDGARHLAIRGRHLALLTVPDRFVAWLPFGIIRGFCIIRKRGIHALYSTSPIPTTHLIAFVLKAFTGLPWAADFRDPWIEEGIHPRPGTLRYRVEATLERLVIRRADRLIVTTPDLGRDLLNRYPELMPEKIQTIYNGYDEGDFENMDLIAPGKLFEIIHAGLVTPEFRDPFPLLREIAFLIADGDLSEGDIRVTFLGGGSYVASNKFAAAVKQLGLVRVVQVIDRVSHQEALQHLKQAAVLLLLQASDDTRSLIPAKTFEYLRIGRPILALTLEGATAHLLKGMNHCYVVDPGDQSSLRSSVLSLYRQWQHSPPEGSSVSRPIWMYERANLTAEIAQLLDKMVAETPVAHS